MPHDQLLVPLEWNRIGRVRGAATGAASGSASGVSACGSASGGMASGGMANGGIASGGMASGGMASGGMASGGSASGSASGAAGNLLGQIEFQDPVVTMLHDRCVYSGGLWIGGAECEDHCLRGV